MADGFSDSDEEKAIENILSQAMDHSVLEQIAAINCSAFGSDSVLPTHLETRFHKLKSFPSANSKSQSSNARKDFSSSSFNSGIPPPTESQNPQTNQIRADSVNNSDSQPNSKDESFSPLKDNPVRKKDRELKSPSGFNSSPPELSDLSMENSIFSAAKQGKTKEKVIKKSESRHGFFGSPLNSSNSSSKSSSPPQKIGCFWCSPKKFSGKKSKENQIRSMELNWGNDDQLLSDLSIFSSREQERILKKAMKEQEKVNREAEKIVKWAKQASMRMEISSVESELSDDDSRI
jgi:hypothetical protein